ncbi:MAG: FAD-binding oxidoreductase [Gammaproteobacteria bacterium]|jgi:glycine/D-amino acid oxidase-like deaminating enzyme|nr:FAD-binding oxidoreductase [Gammaproteobacteria bacterium]
MQKVKNCPQYPDDSGWYGSLPAPHIEPALAGDIAVDALILGAGFAGLSAAHRLSELKPDWKIAVVDALPVGMASSGRNSGFMIDLPHTLDSDSYTSSATGANDLDRQIVAFNRSAITYARELVERYNIDCDWSETGKIHAAATAQGAKSHAAFKRGLDALGEAYTSLSGEQIQAVTGIDYYHSGVHTPGTVALQPVAFVRGLATHLPANVSLYENTVVNGYEWAQPHLLSTPNGQIKAQHVLLCNNGFGAMFGLYKNQLLPLLLFASMTRVMSGQEQTSLGGERQWGLVPSHPAGATIKRTADQRLVVRTGIKSGHKMRYDQTIISHMKAIHTQSYKRRFGGQLPNLEFEYSWGGLLCLSRNEGTVFGKVGRNLYAAICQNGLGVARGTASGKLLAEQVAGHDSELLRQYLQSPRPAWMPPHPISTLGVMGNIWRHESMAGAEA